MFYATKQNKYIVEGTAFELNNIQYPANWLNVSTPEEKTEAGLQEVIVTNSRGDDRFYWVSETLDGAELTYVNTPKDLDQLKENWTKQIKNETYAILQPTDYIDTRNLRDPNYKPEWITWRASVLTKCGEVVTAITNCTTVEELIESIKVEWPLDPSQQQ